MKNETKGSLIAVAVIVIIIVLSLAFSGELRSYEPSKADKWEQFLECSKDEGDMGCDSCYFLIYGKHVY